MGELLLTDGGLEASLVYRYGVDLRLFAAFPLVEDEDGVAVLRTSWEPYLKIARQHDVEFVVDTATWRANPDWAARLGYAAGRLRQVNDLAAHVARDLAADLDGAVVSGVVGPRGDGYVIGEMMSPEQSADYHSTQIMALVEAGVDRLAALTFTYVAETVGVVWAAGLPVLRRSCRSPSRPTDGCPAGNHCGRPSSWSMA